MTGHNWSKKLTALAGFNDFTNREKVLFLTRGIETNVYDLLLLDIKGDTNGARSNFELAQLKLLDYKSILDKRNRHRGISATHSGRGPGSGRGGPARGNLGRGYGSPGPHRGGRGRGGRGRGGRGGYPDRSNRFKNVNTVGGQALNVAKLPDGSWDTVAITHGDHNFLASKQTHVQNKWYPVEQYNNLEPLERRKLFLDLKASGVTKPPVRSVNAVSIGGNTVSEISTLTTYVSTLQTLVDMLVELGAKQNRRITKI